MITVPKSFARYFMVLSKDSRHGLLEHDSVRFHAEGVPGSSFLLGTRDAARPGAKRQSNGEGRSRVEVEAGRSIGERPSQWFPSAHLQTGYWLRYQHHHTGDG